MTIKDLWVFKEFLAVSIIKGTLIFYEKPVIAGSTMWPLSIPTTFPFTDYLDGYSFVPSLEDANVVEFYGVKPDDKVARYLFTFDFKSKSVKVTDTKTIDYPQFDGKHYQTQVSSRFLIVSCGDCSVPQVAFFDRDTLEFVYKSPMEFI